MISLDLKSNTTWKIKIERKEDKINKKNIRFLNKILSFFPFFSLLCISLDLF